MDKKTGSLGIGAALIGLAAAIVGAVLAGKGSGSGRDAGSSGQTDDAPQPLAQTDSPVGPSAPAQPAPTGDEGHDAPDLASGEALGADHRAPPAFRPDIDAPMTPAEREALRPATGPSPSLVSDEGTGFAATGTPAA